MCHPRRQVLILGLHAWEWYGFQVCHLVCHPVSGVSACVSASFSSTPVSRVTQGGTGWHRGGTGVTHPGIRTIPKGEAVESVPFCRVAQAAHLFDHLFILHMYICNTCHLYVNFFFLLMKKMVKGCVSVSCNM